jgi:uncharacterized membrane protein (UPF0127 family)
MSARRSEPLVAGCLVLVLSLVACSHELRGIPAALAGWPIERVRIGDAELTVAIAADKQRGMQGVDDLGGLDGLLFDYGTAVDPLDHGFWMRDVPIALDIAFFDAAGRLVWATTMPRCDEACPLVYSPAPFRWALESEAGSLMLHDGVTLVVDQEA